MALKPFTGKLDESENTPNPSRLKPFKGSLDGEGPTLGETVGGIGRQFGGAAVAGTGAIVRGIGELADSDTIRRAGDAVTEYGDGIRQAAAPEFKRVVSETTPEGDITDPSTWSLGENPTVTGALGQLAGALGSTAPTVAAAAITRGRALPTAAVGGALEGGAAAQEQSERITSMQPEEIQQVPRYRELLASGMTPDAARAELARETGRTAAAYAAPVGAAGGLIEGAPFMRPVQDAISGLAESRLARGAIAGVTGGAAEAAQETAVGMAGIAGANAATGEQRSTTEDSLANAVLGAGVGGALGLAGGLATPSSIRGPAEDGMGGNITLGVEATPEEEAAFDAALRADIEAQQQRAAEPVQPAQPAQPPQPAAAPAAAPVAEQPAEPSIAQPPAAAQPTPPPIPEPKGPISRGINALAEAGTLEQAVAAGQQMQMPEGQQAQPPVVQQPQAAQPKRPKPKAGEVIDPASGEILRAEQIAEREQTLRSAVTNAFATGQGLNPNLLGSTFGYLGADRIKRVVDEVRAERRQLAAPKAREPAPQPERQPDLILAKSGNPFKSEPAAKRAASQNPGTEIVAIEGGWALRKTEGVTNEERQATGVEQRQPDAQAAGAAPVQGAAITEGRSQFTADQFRAAERAERAAAGRAAGGLDARPVARDDGATQPGLRVRDQADPAGSGIEQQRGLTNAPLVDGLPEGGAIRQEGATQERIQQSAAGDQQPGVLAPVAAGAPDVAADRVPEQAAEAQPPRADAAGAPAAGQEVSAGAAGGEQAAAGARPADDGAGGSQGAAAADGLKAQADRVRAAAASEPPGLAKTFGKLADAIEARNETALNNILGAIGNKKSREAFQAATGVTLPKTVRGTKAAITAWAQGTQEQPASEQAAQAGQPASEMTADVQPKVRTVKGKPQYVPRAPETLRAYFKPGNIVPSYSGQDRVLSADIRDDGTFSVEVQAVDADGNALPNEQPRRHQTAPDDRALRKVLGEPTAARGQRQQPAAQQAPEQQEAAPAEQSAESAEPAQEAQAAPAPQPSADAPATPARIENFGEALPGGRAEAKRALDRELTREDIEKLPLSKIWPLSDIEKIEDKFQAALAYAIRGVIPAKPKKGYKLRGWVDRVESARSMASEMLAAKDQADLIMFMRQWSRAMEGFAAKVELLDAINRKDWGRIGDVREYPDAYRLNAAGEREPTPFVGLHIDDKRHLIGGAKTIAEAMSSIDRLLAESDGKKRMQFEIRRSTKTGEIFINKTGDSERRRLKTFEDADAARAFLRDSYDELVAAWGSVKDRDNVSKADTRREQNRPRTGADHRNGRDATDTMFQEAFGFRGVEFGKWVSQGKGAKERQGLINEVYDAFMDLADITGLPPRAMSLGGTLGLALGSRGKGWASAHFEPANLVINLTKTRGAGALAHEWFHALDNYFARQRGGEVPMQRGMKAREAYRANNFITYRPEPMLVHKTQASTPMTKARLAYYQQISKGAEYYKSENWQVDPKHPQGVRTEVERGFAELVEALDNSPMTPRSRANDKTEDGYWGQILERAARAFENFTIARMMEKGYQNDFLANVTPIEDFQRSADRYPYLLPEEVAPIAQAFDSLFGTIRVRNDAGKSILFSRRDGEARPGSMRQQAIEGMVNRIAGSWAVPVRVVATPQDLPAAIQAAAGDGLAGVDGVIDGEAIYLVASNITSPRHALTVLAHEGVGHFGMEGLLGDRFQQTLDDVIALRDAGKLDQAVVDQLAERYPDVDDATWAKEAIAVMAERGVENSVMARVIAAARRLLRELGFKVQFSEADLRAMIGDAARFVRDGEGRRNLAAAQGSPDFSFAGMRSRTADARSSLTAMSRIANGEDAETVRQETGWFKGPDDQWRYEISDRDARMKLADRPAAARFDTREKAERANRLARGRGVVELAEEWSFIPNRESETIGQAIYANSGLPQIVIDAHLSFKASAERRELASTWRENNPEYAKALREYVYNIDAALEPRIFNVLSHPALFAAYPELGRMQLRLLPASSSSRGRASADGIYLREDLSMEEARSTLLHELQHGIQHIEGFATGGNLDSVRKTEDYQQISEYFERKGMPTPDRVAFEVYRRLAGEVEARNVQARAQLSDEFIKVFPPEMTADVPASRVIVTIGGKVIPRAPRPANAPKAPRDIMAEYGIDEAGNFGSDERPQSFGMVVNEAIQSAPGWTGEAPRFSMRNPQTETAEFRRWFGDSKVVDAEGRPLVLYHGTTADFDAFSPRSGADLGFHFGTAKQAGYRIEDKITFANSYGQARGAASILPVYLSIKNPLRIRDHGYVSFNTRSSDGVVDDAYIRELRAAGVKVRPGMTDAEGIEAIEAAGYDGFVYKNEAEGDGEDAWVAFRPGQIKSATGNRGTFDPADPRITFSMRKRVADAISNRNADSRRTWLKALTRQQIVDVGRDQFDVDGGRNLASEFEQLSRQMEADANGELERPIYEGGPSIGEIAETWAKGSSLFAGKAEQKAMGDMASLMHETTLAGIDPSGAMLPSTDEARYRALRARYKALPEAQQKLYRDVRDAYAKRRQDFMDALEARIMASEGSPASKRAMADKLRAHFEAQTVKGPYFPLARFGDYWVRGKKADGETVFHMAETQEEQRKIAMDLRQQGFGVKSGKSIKSLSAEPGVAPGFMADIAAMLDAEAANGRIAPDGVESLKDGLYQMMLESLPEQSVRKHFIHRKGTRGFSTDALRAFSHQMGHGSKQLARVRYAHRIGDTLRAMREAAENAPDPNKAADIVLALDDTFAWMMNPTNARWANRLTSLGFAWYLGISPAAALVNMTQLPIVTLPVLAAQHGWAKASAALLRGSKDYIAGAASKSKRAKLEAEMGGDMGRMLKEMEESGAIERTMTMSLFGLSDSETAVAVGGQRAMQAIGTFFHAAEKANREATAIAAYRLAREAGRGHEAARAAAYDAVFESHFDYSSSNRAAFMRGNMARVLLLFRQYSQNITYYLWRNAYKALKGASKEERREAATKLFGTMAATAAMAGAVGLPGYGMAMAAANMAHALFGDDDEPWDAKVAFRQWLNESFGERAGNILARGGANAVTGLDFSSRTSLGDLWWRSPEQDLEGKDLAFHYLEQFAGPVFGIFTKIAQGIKTMQEGQPLRGLEQAAPKGIADVMKAVRYGTEGATTMRGDPIMEDFSMWNLVNQSMGMAPADLSDQYGRNRALKNAEVFVLDRRAGLLNAYALARRNEDTEGMADALNRIRKFNARWPRLAITADTIRTSIRNRERFTAQAINGVGVNQKLAEELLEITGY